jgi:hypothetical protein
MTETTGPSGTERDTLPGDGSGGAAGAEPAGAPAAHGAHAPDVHAPAAQDAHGGTGPTAHGSHDEAEPLGPVDWGAWAGGILGAAAGLLAAGCLWLSTSGL